MKKLKEIDVTDLDEELLNNFKPAKMEIKREVKESQKEG